MELQDIGINYFLMEFEAHSKDTFEDMQSILKQLRKLCSQSLNATWNYKKLCEALFKIPVCYNWTAESDSDWNMIEQIGGDNYHHRGESRKNTTTSARVGDDQSVFSSLAICYVSLIRMVQVSRKKRQKFGNDILSSGGSCENDGDIEKSEQERFNNENPLIEQDTRIGIAIENILDENEIKEEKSRNFNYDDFSTFTKAYDIIKDRWCLVATTREKKSSVTDFELCFMRLLTAIVTILERIDIPDEHKERLRSTLYIMDVLRKHMRSDCSQTGQILYSRRFYIAVLCESKKETEKLKNIPESAQAIADILRRKKEAIMEKIQNDEKKRALLANLYGMADSISDIQWVLTLQNVPENVVYYTSLNTFRFLLPQKKDIDKLKDSELTKEKKIELLKSFCKPSIMSVSTMNDPEEGYYIQDYLAGNIQRKKEQHIFWWDVASSSNRAYNDGTYVFCRCFSPETRKDDLSMWETYGDSAKGCCVVVKCKGTSLESQELFQICYCSLKDGKMNVELTISNTTESRGIIQHNLTAIKQKLKTLACLSKNENEDIKDETKNAIKLLLSRMAYLFKDASYSHEQEIRYLRYYLGTQKELEGGFDDIEIIERDYSEGKMPLLSTKMPVQLEFAEVILGPKVKDANISAAYLDYIFQILHEYRCEYCGENGAVSVMKSGIKYR